MVDRTGREIQGYADANDTHNFYNAIKHAYGPTTNTTAPVKSRDGSELIKDMERISRRWAEHYELLLNGGLLPNHDVLNDLPQRTIKHVMDLPPSVRELEECIRTLRNRKSPGADGLPAELFKYGGESVLREIH